MALYASQCLADIAGRLLELTAHILELLVDLLGELADLLLHEGEGGVIRLGAFQFLDPAGGRLDRADQGGQE